MDKDKKPLIDRAAAGFSLAIWLPVAFFALFMLLASVLGVVLVIYITGFAGWQFAAAGFVALFIYLARPFARNAGERFSAQFRAAYGFEAGNPEGSFGEKITVPYLFLLLYSSVGGMCAGAVLLTPSDRHTLKHLASLRSAVTAYADAHRGKFPADLRAMKTKGSAHIPYPYTAYRAA